MERYKEILEGEGVTVHTFEMPKMGTYGPTRNDETFNYGQVTLLNTNYLLFQTGNVIQPARQAMAYAINPTQLANDIFKGTASPGYNVTPPPVFPSYDGEPAGPESYDKFAEDNYPYGIDQPMIEEGRALMEEEGYGPDNLYEIELLHFQTNAYQQFAEQLRDKCRSMHIDLSIEATPFSTMINRAVEGNFDIFTNSDGMEWPESDNFLRYFHSTASKESSFARWGQEGRSTESSRAFNEAWQEYLEYPKDTDAQQEARNEAYLDLELAHFEGVAQLPTIHDRGQRWWSQDVENLRMFGPMENQQLNDVTLNR
jgi:peptide/nickel transport system substrate-binding protein